MRDLFIVLLQTSEVEKSVYSSGFKAQTHTIYSSGDQYPMLAAKPCTHAHTAPLQRHPLLPCTACPAPVINRIPLDDITGNKRQQQDNKRPVLQSTSFIGDFITPWLMDVDLFFPTCQSPQDPLHSSSSNGLSYNISLLLFWSIIYPPVTNTSPWINISISIKGSGF